MQAESDLLKPIEDPQNVVEYSVTEREWEMYSRLPATALLRPGARWIDNMYERAGVPQKYRIRSPSHGLTHPIWSMVHKIKFGEFSVAHWDEATPQQIMIAWRVAVGQTAMDFADRPFPKELRRLFPREVVKAAGESWEEVPFHEFGEHPQMVRPVQDVADVYTNVSMLTAISPLSKKAMIALIVEDSEPFVWEEEFADFEDAGLSIGISSVNVYLDNFRQKVSQVEKKRLEALADDFLCFKEDNVRALNVHMPVFCGTRSLDVEIVRTTNYDMQGKDPLFESLGLYDHFGDQRLRGEIGMFFVVRLSTRKNLANSIAFKEGRRPFKGKEYFDPEDNVLIRRIGRVERNEDRKYSCYEYLDHFWKRRVYLFDKHPGSNRIEDYASSSSEFDSESESEPGAPLKKSRTQRQTGASTGPRSHGRVPPLLQLDPAMAVKEPAPPKQHAFCFGPVDKETGRHQSFTEWQRKNTKASPDIVYVGTKRITYDSDEDAASSSSSSANEGRRMRARKKEEELTTQVPEAFRTPLTRVSFIKVEEGSAMKPQVLNFGVEPLDDGYGWVKRR